ncbi:MAG TPA: hypothetical protein VGR81_03625 [Candidatus Acidoferrales bacterium]|nr:hypothetical protein [Candidatus Acidoferrales bacterium]
MNLFSNPEIIRNARIQLRPRKLLIAGGLSLALSAALVYASLHSADKTPDYPGSLLHVILIIQCVVLVFGGGIACLHAVQREKDQNTYDSQRLTRLSPWGLTLGKLFGPPLMADFIFLCFLPAALIGAVQIHSNWTILFVTYVLLIFGAIVFDALALVISLYLRRGTVTWAILAFLFITYAASGGSIPFAPYFHLGPIGPFITVDLPAHASWSMADTAINIGPRSFTVPNPFHDVFFGVSVHHAVVLPFIYITLLAWFLLAAVRNIKRDPENYQLYTPAQALGFIYYLNFILFSFFGWNSIQDPKSFLSPLSTQSLLLSLNIPLFFIFGMLVLRNRVQVRRRLHAAEAVPTGLDFLWPVPYIFAGVIVVGAAMIGIMEWKRNPALEWSLALAIFQVIFFAVWLSVDLLFLQWMNLRRGRHPLALGVLTLAVYYVCVTIIVSALHLNDRAFTAILLPTPLFILKSSLWTTQVAEWLVALAAEAAVALFFALLCRRQLAELQPHPSSISINAPATSASL